MMEMIWVCMVCTAFICAAFSGRMGELSASVMDGAAAACQLLLSISGMIIFWSGIMEIMRRCGLMDFLGKLMRPVVGLLFPSAKKDQQVMGDICANAGANLLGISNAATPAGIRAAQGLKRLSGGSDASDELCMLVIINTASLQLIPTTIAAVRGTYGASDPFDIIPAVWLASIISLAVGILSAKVLSRFSVYPPKIPKRRESKWRL